MQAQGSLQGNEQAHEARRLHDRDRECELIFRLQDYLFLSLTQVRRSRFRSVAKIELEKDQVMARQYQTAFMLAASSSQSQLYRNGMRIEWQRLDTIQPSAAAGGSDGNAADLLRVQPEVRHLPHALRAHIQDPVSPSSTLEIVKAGVLCSQVEWSAERHLQTVHACPEVWQAPWFDSVSVIGTEEVQRLPQGRRRRRRSEADDPAPVPTTREVEWYCQLRLLFRFEGKQMAFVRWYVVDPRAGILESYGCKGLKWETVANGSPRYDVIDLDMIKRMVYVVPDFSKGEGFFRLNPWKWDRGEPCKKGVTPVAADD